MAAGSKGGQLQLLQFSPLESPEAAEAAIELLAQALAGNSLVNYFSRSNQELTMQLLREALRLKLRANPVSRQLICLKDFSGFSAVAVVQQYPADRLPAWSRRAALLRLMAIAPFGKWRALAGCGGDLDKQKQAFAAAHGDFWYLAAIGSKVPGQRLGTALLEHICRLADAQQQAIYAEASSDRMRGFYKSCGFAELMSYTIRPHAPRIVVLARPPRSPASVRRAKA